MTRLSREPSSVTLNTPNPVSAETKILRLTLTLQDSNLIAGHRNDAGAVGGDSHGFDHFQKMNGQFVQETHILSLKCYYTKSRVNREDELYLLFFRVKIPLTEGDERNGKPKKRSDYP